MKVRLLNSKAFWSGTKENPYVSFNGDVLTIWSEQRGYEFRLSDNGKVTVTSVRDSQTGDRPTLVTVSSEGSSSVEISQLPPDQNDHGDV